MPSPLIRGLTGAGAGAYVGSRFGLHGAIVGGIVGGVYSIFGSRSEDAADALQGDVHGALNVQALKLFLGQHLDQNRLFLGQQALHGLSINHRSHTPHSIAHFAGEGMFGNIIFGWTRQHLFGYFNFL